MVDCKWILTVKYKSDGFVGRYKARLVVKWYTQTFGINYQEMFAPIVKMNSVRVLISLAANQNLPLFQFDVKNVFLHGDFEEEVYMAIPPSFYVLSAKGKVCRLKKNIVWLECMRTLETHEAYTWL